ncbi:MAG: thioredoxin family protein [Chlorobi bacterium]|nr:thioredoxin family protein [Chlorobiota bacterium]
MTQKDIFTVEEFERFINENNGAVVYFSAPQCNVCKVLKPKLKEMLAEEFPEMKFAYVDCEQAKELAAQKQIFAAPTILFYLDGREFLRKSRNMNLNIVAEELSRPYEMMFDIAG